MPDKITISPEVQADIIKEAVEGCGLDGHIFTIKRGKDARTEAEKIAWFHAAGEKLPVKASYMYCDTLDVCFYFMNGTTPAVAYSGYAEYGSKDATSGLGMAIIRAQAVLERMDHLYHKKIGEKEGEGHEAD